MRNHFLRAGGIPSSTDTVTMVSGSPFTYNVDNDPVLNGAFSFTLANVPTVPKAGKRMAIIHCSFRLAGNGTYAAFGNWFKPSNQNGSATVTLAGSTPTYKAVARTNYNGTAFYFLRDDLNTSGSDSNITFSFDNSNYSGPNLDGGAAVTIWIFDYVETFLNAWNHPDSNDDTPTSYTLNVNPPGSGSGWTHSFKAVSAVASNPTAGISYTKGTGETDSTYSSALEVDIGSSELIDCSYAFLDTGSPTNITGTVSIDSGSLNNGLGHMTTFTRFKPSS